MSFGLKRLSVVLAPVGCAATLATAYRTISRGFPPSFYDGSALAASVLFAGVHLYFYFTPYSRGKAILQSVVILLIGTLGVLLSRDPGDFGTSMIVAIGVLLSLKNGAFERMAHAVAVFGLILCVDMVLGALLQGASWLQLVYAAVPSIAVFGILYYVFHEELQRIMAEHRRVQFYAENAESRVAELSSNLEAAHRRAAKASAAIEAEHQLVARLQAELDHVRERMVRMDPSRFNLTDREIEVLRLLATKTASNKEIAQALGFTERTAKSHVYNICNKVGVDRRVELIEMFRWSLDDDENRK